MLTNSFTKVFCFSLRSDEKPDKLTHGFKSYKYTKTLTSYGRRVRMSTHCSIRHRHDLDVTVDNKRGTST